MGDLVARNGLWMPWRLFIRSVLNWHLHRCAPPLPNFSWGEILHFSSLSLKLPQSVSVSTFHQRPFSCDKGWKTQLQVTLKIRRRRKGRRKNTTGRRFHMKVEQVRTLRAFFARKSCFHFIPDWSASQMLHRNLQVVTTWLNLPGPLVMWQTEHYKCQKCPHSEYFGAFFSQMETDSTDLGNAPDGVSDFKIFLKTIFLYFVSEWATVTSSHRSPYLPSIAWTHLFASVPGRWDVPGKPFTHFSGHACCGCLTILLAGSGGERAGPAHWLLSHLLSFHQHLPEL